MKEIKIYESAKEFLADCVDSTKYESINLGGKIYIHVLPGEQKEECFILNTDNQIEKIKIDGILSLHSKWLKNRGDGKQAYLKGADLREIYLRGTNLEEANLEEVNLEQADLEEVILKGASLEKANLERASLMETDLRGAHLEEANLKEACLIDADLEQANLGGANLMEANLRYANLTDAYLVGANLNKADLIGASLRGADLENANLEETRIPLPDINILRYQKGKIRAFKLVNENFEGIYRGLKYKIGKEINEPDYDSDERMLCSKGLNVATFEWCLENREIDNKILEVEFNAEDIVAIPYATDGVFRIKRCKVIEEAKKV